MRWRTTGGVEDIGAVDVLVAWGGRWLLLRFGGAVKVTAGRMEARCTCHLIHAAAVGRPDKDERWCRMENKCRSRYVVV